MPLNLFPRAAGKSPEELAAKFVPFPSVGHEMGVMFGFIGAILLGLVVFWIWWHFRLKMEDRTERGRIDELRKRGLLRDGVAVRGEKGPVEN